MTHVSDFRHIRQEFSLKIQNCRFYPIFNVCHHVEFLKNIIKRFWEKISESLPNSGRYLQEKNVSSILVDHSFLLWWCWWRWWSVMIHWYPVHENYGSRERFRTLFCRYVTHKTKEISIKVLPRAIIQQVLSTILNH